MNLTLVSSDNELYRGFVNSSFFNAVTMLDEESVDITLIDDEIIVISDSKIDINSLSTCKVGISQKVFYLVSNKKDEEQVKSIKAVCQSYDIIAIPNKLVARQIIEFVEKTLFPEAYEKKKIAVFMGADSKVGTTMICQSVAEVIANNSSLKVGYFVLSDKKNDNYMQGANSLDLLKGKVTNDLLTKEDILDAMIKKDNIYLLAGISNLLEIRRYSLKHIEALLTMAADIFDVTIVDAGSNLDNPLTIAALKYTNNILMITSQAPASKNQFDTNSSILNNLMLNKESFMLVVNKYIDNKTVFSSANEIAGYYKMLLAGKVSAVGSGHENLLTEIEQKTFNHFEIDEYNEEIKIIARVLSNRLDIKVDLEEQKEKKRIFARFGGK